MESLDLLSCQSHPPRRQMDVLHATSRWHDRWGLLQSDCRNRFFERTYRMSTHRPVTKSCFTCLNITRSCLSNAIHQDSSAEGELILAKSIQESPHSTQAASSEYFVEHYQNVRRFSEHLCEPLVTEDYVIQSMPDVSPTKWHLAHVS